jgi:hypothetical protein
LLTPAAGIEITNSVVDPDVRRNVPLQSTDAGNAAAHPLPFAIVPPHAPYNGSFGAWLIVTVCPAIDSVPVRVSPGFSPTVKVTVPGPVCVEAGETVAKLALLVTDHVHVLPVLTPNVALPPAPDMLNVDVEME